MKERKEQRRGIRINGIRIDRVDDLNGRAREDLAREDLDCQLKLVVVEAAGPIGIQFLRQLIDDCAIGGPERQRRVRVKIEVEPEDTRVELVPVD